MWLGPGPRHGGGWVGAVKYLTYFGNKTIHAQCPFVHSLASQLGRMASGSLFKGEGIGNEAGVYNSSAF